MKGHITLIGDRMANQIVFAKHAKRVGLSFQSRVKWIGFRGATTSINLILTFKSIYMQIFLPYFARLMVIDEIISYTFNKYFFLLGLCSLLAMLV